MLIGVSNSVASRKVVIAVGIFVVGTTVGVVVPSCCKLLVGVVLR